MLHRCHGLSLREISERLDVSLATTKRYLARALELIECEIAKGQEEP